MDWDCIGTFPVTWQRGRSQRDGVAYLVLTLERSSETKLYSTGLRVNWTGIALSASIWRWRGGGGGGGALAIMVCVW